MAAARAPRLTREARREQLLDAAAELLARKGLTNFTMEGLALQAAVSKALPYQHFDNSDDVLVELHRRERDALGARIVEAVQGRTDPEELIRAAVHALFDGIAARGEIWALLSGPGSPGATTPQGGERAGHQFLAALLERGIDVDPAWSKTLSLVIMAAVQGALEAWATGTSPRDDAEEIAVAMSLAAIAATADRPHPRRS